MLLKTKFLQLTLHGTPLNLNKMVKISISDNGDVLIGDKLVPASLGDIKTLASAMRSIRLTITTLQRTYRLTPLSERSEEDREKYLSRLATLSKKRVRYNPNSKLIEVFCEKDNVWKEVDFIKDTDCSDCLAVRYANRLIQTY